jgi:hypothetical protein
MYGREKREESDLQITFTLLAEASEAHGNDAEEWKNLILKAPFAIHCSSLTHFFLFCLSFFNDNGGRIGLNFL